MKPKPVSPVLQVQLMEARPNDMFSAWQRENVRFLRFNRAVACAECGRRSKFMWTALHSFVAINMEQQFIVVRRTGKVFEPLVAICRRHPFGLETWPSARPLASKVEPAQYVFLDEDILLARLVPIDEKHMLGQEQLVPYLKILSYNRPVPCHVCGKELTSFLTTQFSAYVGDNEKDGKVIPPLSRICREHRYFAPQALEEPHA